MDLMSIRKPLSEEIYNKVLEAKVWLDSIAPKLVIFDKQLNAEMFYATIKDFMKQHGLFSLSEDGRKEIYTPSDDELIIDIVIDHLGLVSPNKGRTKKEEIDLISTFCVRFREVCGVSIDALMQENRNAGNVDRVKMQSTESTMDDVKDSGNVCNDALMVIAVYYPIKYKLREYRGYRICDDKETGALGLGSSMRSLILLKNRFGSANKVFPVGFQGSIGKFVELPKPEEIIYEEYQSWKDERIEEEKDENVKDEKKTQMKFKF